MEKLDKYKTIDEYIFLQPVEVQPKLQEIRMLIKEIAPEAEETISYQMPTFKLNGNLVHFASYKNHIGFYPAPSGISAFEDDIMKYKFSKGTVQFPLNQPLPLDLIKRIVLFRIEENILKKKKEKK